MTKWPQLSARRGTVPIWGNEGQLWNWWEDADDERMIPAPPTSLPSPAIALCHRAVSAARWTPWVSHSRQQRMDADSSPEAGVAVQSRGRVCVRGRGDPSRAWSLGDAAAPAGKRGGSEGLGGPAWLRRGSMGGWWCWRGAETGVQGKRAAVALAGQQSGLRGRSEPGSDAQRPRGPPPIRRGLRQPRSPRAAPAFPRSLAPAPARKLLAHFLLPLVPLGRGQSGRVREAPGSHKVLLVSWPQHLWFPHYHYSLWN